MKTLLAFLAMQSVALGAEGAAPDTAHVEHLFTMGFGGALAGAAAYVRWPALRTKEGVGGAMGFGVAVAIFAPLLVQGAVLIGIFYAICKIDFVPIVDQVFDGIGNIIRESRTNQRQELETKLRAAESLAQIAHNHQEQMKRPKRRKPKVMGPSVEERYRQMVAEIEEARREAKERGFSEAALEQDIQWIRSKYKL